MRRSNGMGTLGGLILVVLLFIARPGCDVARNPVVVQDYYPAAGPTENSQSNQNYQQVGHTSLAPSTVIIGSFNIQTFGPTKASRPEVMSTLVDIVRRYDLLAIQELRNEDQSVIPQFINQINSDGSRYSYIVGPRQGYTYSKEQYAYIYDTAKFRLTSKYVAADPDQTMHRPPLVASFECTQAPAGKGFSFTIANLHIDPDTVGQEFAALETIIPSIVANHPGEDDFIVVGDFNDTAKAIRRYRWLPKQWSLVRSNWSTKVRSGRSIDNIVIDTRTAEYKNQSGVLDVARQYGLNEQQTLKVSDHFPVWAVFSTQEVAPRYASAPDNPNR